MFWEAPSSTGGAPIDSYDLRWIASSASDKSDANWTVVGQFWTSGALTGVVSGLVNGTGYDFAMRAITANGDGAWSAAVSGTPRDSAPRISGAAPGESAFTVAWTAPSEIVAGDTVAYRMRWIRSDAADKSDARWQMRQASQAQRGWDIVRGLSNGVSYDIQVRAETDHHSAWSSVSRVTPQDAPGTIRQNMPLVTLGVPVAARLASGTDVDYFKITIAADAAVMLRTSGAAVDTECFLRDDQGRRVARNDDGNLPHGARHCLFVETLTAGTHYLAVRGLRRSWQTSSPYSGTYVMHADAVDEPGDSAGDATEIAIGEVKAGRISSTSDVDYVKATGGAADQWVNLAIRRTTATGWFTATLLDGNGTEVGGGMHAAGHVGVDVKFRLPKGTERFVKIESRYRSTSPYAYTLAADNAYQTLLAVCANLRKTPTGSQTNPQESWHDATGWDDELAACQWHLHNVSQRSAGTRGEDARVAAAHKAGYLGAGVNVAILDTGVDVAHEDLSGNASAARAHSYCTHPSNDLFSRDWPHGTRVAGVIAARDNKIGMRGVAPRAQIYSWWAIDCYNGNTPQSAKASAFTRDIADIAVSVNSWNHVAGPAAKPTSALTDRAIETGLRDGFSGKGTTYVIAAGNGRLSKHDAANLSEYNTHYGMIAVCATGPGGSVADYSNRGANLWVCGPSHTNHAGSGIATLDPFDRYYTGFGGTSAATPTVGGVAALMRGANPALTWRDVKLILAASARRPARGAFTRGAAQYRNASERYFHSPDYGFGVVDAHAATQLAKNWKLVPEMITATASKASASLTIPDPVSASAMKPVSDKVKLDDKVEFIEHVEVDTHFNAESFRHLDVDLISPQGTVSKLSWLGDVHKTHPLTTPYRFASSRHLGERAEGEWTLRITDRRPGNRPAVLHNWSVTVRGHRLRPSAPTSAAVSPGQNSYDISWGAPQHAGASAVTGYEIRHIDHAATNRDDSAWTTVTVAGGATARTHSLTATAAGSRDVQVRAINAEGSGAWSTTATATLNASNAEPRFTFDAATLSVAENTPSGVDVGSAFTASDADAGATLTYSLSGTHASDFALGSSTGQIQTESALDRETQAAYSVVVSVSDGRDAFGQPDTGADDSVAVTISITDVDEPFTLACTAAHPGASRWELPEPDPVAATSSSSQNSLLAGTCGIVDPEGSTASYSLSGDDADAVKIDDAGRVQFKKSPDYESPDDSNADNVYKFTVTAQAGSHSRSASVETEVTDVDEPPLISGSGSIAVAEGRSTQDSLGSFSAADPEAKAATLSLGGPDSAYLALDSSGSLRFTSVPDFEKPFDADRDNVYRVTVMASDGTVSGELDVAVTVTDVDELPTLESRSCSFSLTENSRAAWTCTFAASDPEGRAVSWSTQGADAARFELTGSGGTRRLALRTGTVLDYETKPAYAVSVQITDSGPASLAVTQGVRLDVSNVDEPGTVELSSTLPRVDTVLTASLADGDGPSAVSWQWQRRSTGWADITGATSADYTPVAADLRMPLRAVAAYTDGPFGQESVTSAMTRPTRDASPANSAPVFGAASLACTMPENQRAGILASCALAANDSDPDDRVEYRVEPRDAVPFNVVGAGRLRTTRSLDYETVQTWEFQLVASDGQDETRAAVTITVTNVDEAESIALAGELRVGSTLDVSLDGGDCPGGAGCIVTQWLWERSADGRSWTKIIAEQAGSLLLESELECQRLRVRADYEDAHGESQIQLLAGGSSAVVRPDTGACVTRRQPGTTVSNVPPFTGLPPGGGAPPGGGGVAGGSGTGGGSGDREAAGEAARLWGADRYATSLAVAREVAALADGRLSTVVLAGGHSWADALTAGPLAGALDAVLLLTPREGLGEDAVAWLGRVGVREVIAVGTTEHISDGALAALVSIDSDIERIEEPNRHAAAAAVARRIGQPETLGPLLGRTVIVASARVFADALAAGPLAASGPHPVLLTDPATLHPDAAAYLADHADHVIVMGGTAAVSTAVEDRIRAIPQANRSGQRPMAVTRIGGADRYATAVGFARWLASSILEGRVCFTADTVGLATGANAADAAASAPLLARECAPLVLTGRDRMPPITASYLRRASELIVFGGAKAVSESVLRAWSR